MGRSVQICEQGEYKVHSSISEDNKTQNLVNIYEDKLRLVGFSAYHTNARLTHRHSCQHCCTPDSR